MMKLSEEGMSKAKTEQKLCLLHKTVSQLINAKGNFLKEIKHATPAHAQIRNSLTADMQKVVVVWIDYWTSYPIYLSQALTQSVGLTLFNSQRLREVKKLQKKSWKLAEFDPYGFQKENISINPKVQDEAAPADVEAAASYP